MATRHRSKLRQAAERAAADIEGHSATAKFCQPRRLTRGVAEAPSRSEVNCPIDPSSLEQMRGRDRNQPVRNEKRDRYYECQQNEFDSVPSRQWMLLCALSAHKTPTSVRYSLPAWENSHKQMFTCPQYVDPLDSRAHAMLHRCRTRKLLLPYAFPRTWPRHTFAGAFSRQAWRAGGGWSTPTGPRRATASGEELNQRPP